MYKVYRNVKNIDVKLGVLDFKCIFVINDFLYVCIWLR